MKIHKLTYLFFVFCYISTAQSQTSNLKIRTIIVPFCQEYIFNVGLGYEKTISNHFSTQILINHSWINYELDDILQSSNKIFSINPELRYNFKGEENIGRSIFLGVYAKYERESYVTNTFCGNGYHPYHRNHSMGLGLSFGKNFMLTESLGVDIYIGKDIQYKRNKTVFNYNKEFEPYLVDIDDKIDYSFVYNSLPRVGFNIFYQL